jgi:hypothetical protein
MTQKGSWKATMGACAAHGMAIWTTTAATMTRNGASRSPATSASSRRSASRGFSRACPGSPSCASARVSARPSPASISTRWQAFGETDIARLPCRHRHRAPPRQDRLDDQQCRPRAGAARRVRHARPLFLEFRAGAAGTAGKGGLGDDRRQSDDADLSALSKDLKKRGWTFVGPTTVYAFMQAMGLVNDHIEGCFCREEVEQKRKQLTRP